MTAVPERTLHIAWLGPAPGEGGVAGVATDLLQGLSARGHRIDCFLPSAGLTLPERLRGRAEPVRSLGHAAVAVGPLVQPHAASPRS